MPEIVAVGEALAEIMRKKVGVGLDVPDDFVGPFPSGAPAIFADQAARLGHSVAFVGAVGADAFGRLILYRLQQDGVDVSLVATIDDLATGVAFVTYYPDGSRQFIFHIGNSAAGRLPAVPSDLLADASWLHICGSSLAASPRMRQVCYDAVEAAGAQGCRVSFDPNLRPELLAGGLEEFRRLCEPVLARAAAVLPGTEELAAITGVEDPKAAAQTLLAGGAELVAVKLGAAGCMICTPDHCIQVPGYSIQAVDPTGAGDCFDAAIVCGLIEGLPPADLGRLANACGALGAAAKGPMEGARPRAQVQAFMRRPETG